jgi:hypothetical protein
LIRLEGFQIALENAPISNLVSRASPISGAFLRPTGSIRVRAIAGIPVPTNPAGSFVLPDVAIGTSAAVDIEIEATGIPPGTPVTLEVYPQDPPDLTMINFPSVQTILTGTLQSSTATVQFTFPYGFSRGVVRATW